MENTITKEEINNSLFADKDKLKLALSRAISLLLVSLFLACAVISVVNDMYAFVKNEGIYEINITEPLNLYGFSKRLGKENIIQNPFAFFLYVHSKGKEDLFENISGNFKFNSAMSYREILSEIQNKK